MRLGRADKFVLLSAFTYICHISHRFMESSDILNEIKRIAKEVLPKGGQLILYGSRARNEATEDSDWDLLILLDKQEIEKQDRDEVAPYYLYKGKLEKNVIYSILQECRTGRNSIGMKLQDTERQIMVNLE